MESSPLDKLPGEIRNIIWDYALTADAVCLEIRESPILLAEPPLCELCDLAALTRTCRKIRSETIPFYLSNIFKLQIITDGDFPIRKDDIYRMTEAITEWFLSLGDYHHRKWLTRLEIYLKGYNTCKKTDYQGQRRPANLHEAETFLVYLQKHFVQYFGLNARLIVRSEWSEGQKDMFLDFSAPNVDIMLERVDEEGEKALQWIQQSESETYERYWDERRDLESCWDHLFDLVFGLEYNPDWKWTEPNTAERNEKLD